jgi:hypothetical protein
MRALPLEASKREGLRQEHTTHLTIDEFEITRALGVTISRPILRTGFVSGIFSHSTILVHRDEVQSAIETLNNRSLVIVFSQELN